MGESRQNARMRKRSKITVELPAELVEQLRNTAYWLSGPPMQMTVTSIIERALVRELDQLREHHNEGKMFKARVHPLRAGRPIGS